MHAEQEAEKEVIEHQADRQQAFTLLSPKMHAHISHLCAHVCAHMNTHTHSYSHTQTHTNA